VIAAASERRSGALEDVDPAVRDLFADSPVARASFGDEVVDHYVNMADVELTAFDAHVTDWELARSFERM
jgi:glutamine synthetase